MHMLLSSAVQCKLDINLFASFFFQAEDGIRYLVRSRGLGDVYKRQSSGKVTFLCYCFHHHFRSKMRDFLHFHPFLVMFLSLIHI